MADVDMGTLRAAIAAARTATGATDFVVDRGWTMVDYPIEEMRAARVLLELLDGVPDRVEQLESSLAVADATIRELDANIQGLEQVAEAARAVARLWDEDVDDAGPTLERLIKALASLQGKEGQRGRS